MFKEQSGIDKNKNKKYCIYNIFIATNSNERVKSCKSIKKNYHIH